MNPSITPIIRARREHIISRRDLDPDALKVLYRLTRAGHTAYLVGGSVRDLLLARTPKDFDISTDAQPRQLQKMFSNCILIGRRFRLAHLRYGDKVIETSTFRAKPVVANDDLLQTDDNVFGTAAEDALRRDFTINGLFYCVEAFTVIDYVGGLADLSAKLIRSIGDPQIRFQEDPIRMLRAIRFAARLDFTIEEETYAALVAHKTLIHKASKPRLLEEIYRLFQYRAGEKAVRLLWQTGMLAEILPTINNYLQKFQNPETALLWQYLSAAEQTDIETPDLFIASLFFPLIAEKLSLPPAMMSQRDLYNAYDEIVSPFLEFYKVPRRVGETARLLVSNQHRFFVNVNKVSPKRLRFMTQAWFPATLQLFTIINTANNGDRAIAIKWHDLYRAQAGKPTNEPSPRHSPNNDENSAENNSSTKAISINHPQNKKRRRRRYRRPPRTAAT